MTKMTKAQAKRMLHAIDSKAKRLWTDLNVAMSTADVIAINKIVAKNLKRLG